MHELSIAYSLVETATEVAKENNFKKIDTLHVNIGVLAGVVKEALQFSFDIATEGTLVEGAQLLIEEIPVTIYCSICNEEQTLSSPIPMQCPICEQKTGEMVTGKEIELYSLEGSE